MNIETLQIVDRGRGPQLSTSRITVLDLVPYFQAACPFEEILRWLPTLSMDELVVAQKYYIEHREALDEKDRQVRQYRDEQIQLQRERFPEMYESSQNRIERMKRLLEARRRERNGEGHPG